MNDTFNLRSFVENQVEKLSTPKNLIVDKFRQTVDTIKSPFSSSNNNTEQDATIPLTINNMSYTLCPLESLSSSSTSSISSNGRLLNSHLISTNIQDSITNIKNLSNKISYRCSPLKRHVSESNKSDVTNLLRPIYHDNPPINVDILFNQNNLEKLKHGERSRSLIRQSTEATCTFPIRHAIRRLESVEIPGLNGVKSIRYINDDLGKLQPDLYKKQTSENDPSYNTGKITFTLFYNQSLTSLIITILSIDQLPYRNFNSKVLPNPFIKLTLLPDRRKKFQTKLYKHTQSTQFNETFHYPISYEQLNKRILLLSIYDFRRSTKRNLIGTVKIDDICSIPDITLYDIIFTKNIMPSTESDPDLGELTISLCYLPNAKRVTVTIVKATSLKPMDITGKSDPYVKVLLLINGKRIRKKKTSVISNTLNPMYNESLEFDLSNEHLQHADLIFKVIDYDRVGLNELIGCTGIGIHFHGINRNHWYQMLEYPHVPITQNYNLCETIPIITCTDSKVNNKQNNL
ncbi:unnamed protein product [Adineta steineri]|uniref:C2 domain-containing protein n=1 Tax=Adineta steineri TaxID=433720 RepID=A0A814N541_9BILA|nr:unnamed protein product [Adineta steineri]CAF3726971.1 unnamed protein product [Adineta steineri]